MDELAHIDTTKLYPPFLARLADMLRLLAMAHLEFKATAGNGTRTYQEQRILFDQGRITPGPKVTNARGGQSAHNFGLAVDFARDVDPRPGLQPDWEPRLYEPLGRACDMVGLLWGGSWLKPDGGHVQWPGFTSPQHFEPLHRQMMRGGLIAAWAYVDRLPEPPRGGGVS